MPQVSVIIPTYNREQLLFRALDSVLRQTYQDFDLWVVDDGSTDGTERHMSDGWNVRPYAGESGKKINYVKTPNRGVAAARNSGVRLSSGKWIALLDSDDEWMPDKLERQIEFARTHPEYSLIHTDEIWIRNGIRVNPPQSYRKYGGEVFLGCLPLCMISPSTSMFTRELFFSTGGFDEDYPVCEDYDFWLKICSLGPAGYVDSPLTVKHGGHPDQLSTSRPGLDYWRIRSLCRILEIRTLIPEWKDAVHREITRRGNILLKGCRKHGNDQQYREVLALIRGSERLK